MQVVYKTRQITVKAQWTYSNCVSLRMWEQREVTSTNGPQWRKIKKKKKKKSQNTESTGGFQVQQIASKAERLVLRSVDLYVTNSVGTCEQKRVTVLRRLIYPGFEITQFFVYLILRII